MNLMEWRNLEETGDCLVQTSVFSVVLEVWTLPITANAVQECFNS